MNAFDTGRRLCLLFEAGLTRYAVEATSVTEVASPDPSGARLRGNLELLDLSVLLGGPEETRPGMAVVFDTSPTLAVRINRILEVVDVSGVPHFLLPPELTEQTGPAIRGALLQDARLYLELHPESVPRKVPSAEVSHALRPPVASETASDRALVFESQGGLYGIPLSLVSQVVQSSGAFSPLPAGGRPVAGVFAHAQSLWPIVSAPALLGEKAEREELYVLAEVAGRNIGLCAARVLGVFEDFRRSDVPGAFDSTSLGRSVRFLDLQRMFS